MLGIIIQARLGSTRLPKKVLKPFAGSTLLMFLIQRLSVLNLPIIVATTISEKDDELCEYLVENKIKYFRGSENNVLERYIEAADSYGITEIIRICSDSPFVDIVYLRGLIDKWHKEKVDYLSYAFQGKPTVLCHYGVFAELTKLETLKKVISIFENKYYCEHVTYGIYKNTDLFSVKLLELPSYFSRYDDIRITVDTEEDYSNIQYLYSNITNITSLSFIEMAEEILKNNFISEIMKKNIKNNKKT